MRKNSLYSQFLRSLELGKLGLEIKRLHGTEQENKKSAQTHLVERLASLRGLPQKFGQILSLKSLGDKDSPFIRLTEDDRGAPFQDFHNWLKDALGQKAMLNYSTFCEEGQAASLGQVHKAQLLDGTQVAVKVQYPQMKEAIEADLRALGWLSLPLAGAKHSFDLDAYRRELKRSLLLEIDYRQEVRAMERFREAFKNHDNILIPEPLPELCSEQVITMTWLDGHRFSDILIWELHEREQIVSSLIDFFLYSWLVAGIGHGDPHSGNYRFRKLPSGIQIGILDFGCILELDSQTRLALQMLIHPEYDLDEEQALEVFCQIGFSRELLFPLKTKLRNLIEIFRMPFLTDRPFNIQSWCLSERISQLLGEEKWNFRSAGPPALIGLVRSFSGLVQYAQALGAPVSWRERLLTLSFAKNNVSNVSIVPSATVTRIIESEADINANYLRIHVVEDNKTKVQIKLPAEAVYNFYEIIPPEILASLLKQDTNIDEILDNVQQMGLSKRALFQQTTGTKKIFVDLI